MTDNNTVNIEQDFLENIQSKNINVQIYLGSGVKMIGAIKNFDDCTITLSHPTYGVQLVYKHAISTISPSR